MLETIKAEMTADTENMVLKLRGKGKPSEEVKRSQLWSIREESYLRGKKKKQNS